jgi:hypothetical protein
MFNNKYTFTETVKKNLLIAIGGFDFWLTVIITCGFE